MHQSQIMSELQTFPVGVLNLPAERKGGMLRVLRKDFPRADGSLVAIFAVLWNDRDAGDGLALERTLSRSIEGAGAAVSGDYGGKKRVAVDGILEHIARTTNTSLLREIEFGGITRLPRTNAVVAAIHQNELALVGHGSVHAFLFRIHKRKLLPTDLLHLDEKLEKKSGARNFFGEYVSGTIHQDDAVVLGANTIFDYLSLEHLGTLVAAAGHPDEAVQKITHLLRDAAGAVPLGEVMLRSRGAKVTSLEPRKPVQSMEAFFDTQEATHDLLEPTAVAAVKNWMGNIRMPKIKIPLPSFRIPRPKMRVKVPRAVREAHHTALSSFVDWFNTIPTRAKIIFPLVLFGIVLFFQSVQLVRHTIKTSHARKEFESRVTQIKEKTNNAEASVLYGNETGAREALGELINLSADLQAPEASLEGEAASVRALVADLRAKLAHRVAVAEIKTVATFPESASNEISLALVGAELLALDRGTNLVYAAPAESVAATLQNPTTLQPGAWRAIFPQDKTSAIALGDTGAVSISTHDSKATPLFFDPAGKNLDGTIWNKRLYRLTESGDIFKHERSESGFAKGVRWQKENLAAPVQSMAIDSVIYVLGGGTVKKYLSGRELPWTFPSLDEPMKSPVVIRTWPDSGIIAVLDPGTHRIIFARADGKLIAQYDHENLSLATDFSIDPIKKVIYVAGHKSLFSFPFEVKK